MSSVVQRSQHIPASALTLIVAAFALIMLFAVAFDQSFLLTGAAQANNVVHEFFHDARHLLGVPCH